MSLLADLAEALRRAPGYALSEELVVSGGDVTVAAPGILRPLLVAALFRAAPGPTLLVVPGELEAERFERQVGSYLPHQMVMRYPVRAAHPWDRDRADVEGAGKRARVVHALDSGTTALAIAPARALLRTVAPHGAQVFDPVVLEPGSIVDLEGVGGELAAMGYERVGRAEDRGQFAVRGGTLDIFPSDGAYPVRADLFGDEIETLRRFVSSTGQSIGDVDRVEVYPAREVRLSARAVRAAQEELGDRAEADPVVARDLEFMHEHVYFNGVETYLPALYKRPGSLVEHVGPSARVVAIEPRAIFADLVRGREAIDAAAKRVGVDTNGLYVRPGDVDLGGRPRTTILSLLSAGGTADAEIVARRPDVAGGEERLASGIRALTESAGRVVFAARDPRMRERLSSLLVDSGVPVAAYADARPVVPGSEADRPQGLEAGAVTIALTDVPAGCVVPGAGLSLVTTDDAFPRARRAAGEHFVQYRSQAVDVGAVADAGVAPDLFGRHITQRALQIAQAGHGFVVFVDARIQGFLFGFIHFFF